MKSINKSFKSVKTLSTFVSKLLKDNNGTLLILGDKWFIDTIQKLQLELIETYPIDEDITESDNTYDFAIIHEDYLESVSNYKINNELYIISCDEKSNVVNYDFTKGKKDNKKDTKTEQSYNSNFEEYELSPFEKQMSDMVCAYADCIVEAKGNIDDIIGILESMYINVYNLTYLNTKLEIANDMVFQVNDEAKELGYDFEDDKDEE
ncbi:hypothetical protein [Clostridium sp.]|uniref:hypothetical protein n=1 Tax=Clostridium sp. TaxID=1506 RepID=UPI00260B4B22|nr:hypothetical protein [Clostridium sp.]